MEILERMRRFALISKPAGAIALIALSCSSGDARAERDVPEGKPVMPGRAPIIDGRFVHNIGNLQLNVTNWGFVGSLPKSRYPMADVPSAQYPAGSGIEYLYAAGIWVGAERNGIPFVSTGYPETEFYPPITAQGTIFRAWEGMDGGGRLPGDADDDDDGRIDEDWLDGIDNDGDGRVDEDFAAYGKQMFSCWYIDHLTQSRAIWPEHEPMYLKIRQETFQWGEDEFEDFVAARYWIENVGLDYLENVYVGLYADVDAGPRIYGSYHLDDLVGFWQGWWCARQGTFEEPMAVKIAYVYDADGDDGRTPGYFGIAFMGHSTDPNGRGGLPRYPARLLSSFRIFQGLTPFVDGGDPTNDYERYDVLASRMIEPDTEKPGDYRILLSCGPIPYLPPRGSFFVDFAFVAGDDLDDLRDNAAAAQKVYEGMWYDLDGDPNTGVSGRESPLIGPLDGIDPDLCDPVEEKLKVAKGETLWANLDCTIEGQKYWNNQCFRPIDFDWTVLFTGVYGREHHLHWTTGTAPSLPGMRVVPMDRAIEVYWDDLSEKIPDPVSGLIDFEGYQIWRADDWHRPRGTTEETGPSHDLWSLRETRDIVNGVPPDRGIDEEGMIYDPLSWLKDRGSYLSSFEISLINFPADTVPCPAGLSEDVCDTIEAMARYTLGLPGGKRYYHYVDREAKNGLPYFYGVAPYDHTFKNGLPHKRGRYNSPASNFVYARARPDAQEAQGYEERDVYVIPNPVTDGNMAPWRLDPNNDDATGLRCEFRNLPRCLSTIRIYTISGDLVKTIRHDGSGGDGTAPWNLLSRNGQDVTSGVYIFNVEPHDGSFPSSTGKFVIIR